MGTLLKITAGVLIMTCWSCAPYSVEDLAGNWQAVIITEEGDSLAMEVANVQFLFNQNGTYEYHSTLNFKESGHFRIDGPYLFTTDTTSQISVEKAVEIARLENDTLEILMKEMGKERRIMAVRK